MTKVIKTPLWIALSVLTFPLVSLAENDDRWTFKNSNAPKESKTFSDTIALPPSNSGVPLLGWILRYQALPSDILFVVVDQNPGSGAIRVACTLSNPSASYDRLIQQALNESRSSWFRCPSSPMEKMPRNEVEFIVKATKNVKEIEWLANVMRVTLKDQEVARTEAIEKVVMIQKGSQRTAGNQATGKAPVGVVMSPKKTLVVYEGDTVILGGEESVEVIPFQRGVDREPRDGVPTKVRTLVQIIETWKVSMDYQFQDGLLVKIVDRERELLGSVQR